MGLAEAVWRSSKCKLSAIQRAILKGLEKNHAHLEAECDQLYKIPSSTVFRTQPEQNVQKKIK